MDNNYWRSFEELYNDPEFIQANQNEFPEGASEKLEPSKLSVISRRKFLALMSASAALAAAGCADYRDKGDLVPYNKKPEEITVGVPNYYASTCTGCNNACGILVKTREGRPIKIDGNPDHPVNKGKICAKGQASILNMYDPARLKEPMYSSTRQDHKQVSWDDVNTAIINQLKKFSSSGKEIAIITHTIQSPSQKNLFDDFQTAYPTAKIYSYELINEANRNNAWAKCYGKGLFPVIKWDKARIILALESDFLGNEGSMIENARLYAGNRDALNGNEFNRMYSVEGGVTLTGMNADYRIRLRTDAIEEFVLSLLNEFLLKRRISGYSSDPDITSVVKGFALDDFISKYNLKKDVINTLVNDLAENRGSAIVHAGTKLPESTHIAVNLLNEVLGNTKLYSEESASAELVPLSKKEDFITLIGNMQAGKVGAVIHFDTNPVYHFAPDYNYKDVLKDIPLVAVMTELESETGKHSNYILPINHFLESWGDYKTRTGFYSSQQPQIAPIYNTRQKEAILLTWIKGNADAYSHKLYHDYIMSFWEKTVYPSQGMKEDFKQFRNIVLHDGVAYTKDSPEPIPSFKKESFVNSNQRMQAGNDYVVILQDNYSIGDGRYSNNGWLQELPHPISRVVWDNYAAVSVQAASELHVDNNDMIEVAVEGRSVKLPVFIQPGLADKVIEIMLGYGRTKAGVIGSGVGVNAAVLMTKASISSERIFNNPKISRAEGTYELISVQKHFTIEKESYFKDIQFKREIIQEGTYEEYRKNPKFLTEERPKVNLQNITHQPGYPGLKWGMAIDLNKCTGCGACVTACNVENNIPVVGKDQVKVSREMQWIRIDRYYSGKPEEPGMNFQVMLCQQCDNAPCENVCPVAATNHSPDGLNQQTYNRCVGTRYCSNNCPYKVRRFNFYNYRDHVKDAYYEEEPMSLLYNPEVTVRSRGVMEKCTFCIQRIMDERQKAIQENRDVIGSNIKTACQEACPSYAIEFGDTHAEGSPITQYLKHDLAYYVMEELNVRPNVTYIAKLRNIKPEKE
jgi:MoCo/4Fe-4S cofactor protein with predicted Tat translocation signal